MKKRIAPLSIILVTALTASAPLPAQRSYQTFWEQRFSERQEPEIVEDDAPPLDPSSQQYLFEGDNGLLHPEAPFRGESTPNPNAGAPMALLHYSRGVLAFESGQMSQALREFERALEADDSLLAARLKAAETALGVNDLSRATLLFEQVLERDPENVEAMLGLGQALLMRNRVEEARVLMERVLNVRPRNISALRTLAQIAYESDQNFEKALEYSARILTIDDRNIHALLWSAEASALTGKMDASVGYYRRLFRQRPALVERMIHISGRLTSLNRNEDAARLYQEAVRVYPGHQMILRLWEEHLGRLGGADRVRRGYEELRAENPLDTQLSELQARYLKRVGDWDALTSLRREILENDLGHIPSLLDMAEYHLEREEFELAEPYFQAAVNANPGDGDIFQKIGRAYLDHGRHDKAAELLNLALAYRPTDIDNLTMMSMISEHRGDLEGAIRHLRAALRESPANANLLSKLGSVYLRSGDAESAKGLFQQVTAANPTDIDNWILLANIYFKEKDETALSVLEEQARRHLRGRPDFEFRYGLLGMEMASYDRARVALERALTALPENLEVRHALVRACLHLNLPDLAFRIAREGTEHTDVDAELQLRHQYLIALAYTWAGRHESAETVYRGLATTHPDDFDLRSEVVHVLLRQGKNDDAREELARLAGDFEADLPKQTRLLRAQLLVRTGEYQRALESLTALEKEYPGDEDVRFRIAVTAGEAGNLELAESIYREFIDMGGPGENGWYETATNNLGYLFAEKGIRLDEAEELIRRALTVNPNAAYILDSMGWVYFQRGEFSQAREYLERAEKLSLGDGEILLHLGQLYEQLGEFEKARNVYERAVEVDPLLPLARERRDALARDGATTR